MICCNIFVQIPERSKDIKAMMFAFAARMAQLKGRYTDLKDFLDFLVSSVSRRRCSASEKDWKEKQRHDGSLSK